VYVACLCVCVGCLLVFIWDVCVVCVHVVCLCSMLVCMWHVFACGVCMVCLCSVCLCLCVIVSTYFLNSDW
jgi:hypothetical protein